MMLGHHRGSQPYLQLLQAKFTQQGLQVDAVEWYFLQVVQEPTSRLSW